MAEKRPTTTSTEEPAAKKQVIVNVNNDTKVMDKKVADPLPPPLVHTVTTDVSTQSENDNRFVKGALVLCMKCNEMLIMRRDSDNVKCYKCHADFNYRDYNQKANYKRILIHQVQQNSLLDRLSEQPQVQTQRTIENCIENTARAEEDKERAELRTAFVSSFTQPCNQDQKNLKDMRKFMKEDPSNIPKVLLQQTIITRITGYLPGQPVNKTGVSLNELGGIHYNIKKTIQPNTFNIDTKSLILKSINDKCSICNNNEAIYTHKEDFLTSCPFAMKFRTTKTNDKLTFYPARSICNEKIEFNNPSNNTIPTLCEECIRKKNIKNTSLDNKVRENQ
jgi:hypothetical protein